MRVLTLTSSYPKYPGDSTAPFIELMTRHVAERGHEIHVVVPEHRDWNRPGVEGSVHYHPFSYSPSRSWTPWGYAESLQDGVRVRRPLYILAPIVLASALRTCSRLLADREFDVVHAHWVVPSGSIGASVARRTQTPLMVSLHGSDVTLATRSQLAGALAKRALARASVVTAASSYVMARAEGLGARMDTLAMLPYGVETHRFRPDAELMTATRARLGVDPDATLVLGIGRLVDWKGFDYLVDAVAAVRAAQPRLRTVIVGDGDLRADLERRAASRGLRDVVTFAGAVPHSDVPAYYAAADLVVVPSIHHDAGFFEALGNVVLEAHATAKPVIASRVGGLVDVVHDQIDGILVPERSADALADAIGVLANDRTLRAAMGEAGRARVVREQTWDDSARHLEALYERAASTRRSSRSTGIREEAASPASSDGAEGAHSSREELPQPRSTDFVGPIGNASEKYAERNPLIRALLAGFLQTVDESVAAIRPGSILDVGCGEGIVTERLARLTGVTTVGVDLGNDYLRAEWADRDAPLLSFRAASAYELPFDDASFECVCALEVLEHLERPLDALAEMRRVAGRALLVSVPREPLWRIAHMLAGRDVRSLGNTPGHINHWSSREFRRCVSAYGRVTAFEQPFPWTVVALDVR